MDPYAIIDKYYSGLPELRRILVLHSEAVMEFGFRIAERHPELELDVELVRNGSLLHDIGIIRTWAPGIECRGELPYIAHGIAGSEMLRSEGLEDMARICERHTGAGLTAREIREQRLPLPERDFLPETPEEKLICYADKFFSKSGTTEEELRREKSLDSVLRSMERHGVESLARFEALHSLFS